jgi:hypothetical protein
VATGLCQIVDQLALLVVHLLRIDEAPVTLVEPERLFCCDDVAGRRLQASSAS